MVELALECLQIPCLAGAYSEVGDGMSEEERGHGRPLGFPLHC